MPRQFDTMKVFLTVRKFYQVAVICRPQTEQNYHFRFSWKYLIYIAFLVQASISAMTYFLFKAHSIVEHADAFYTFSTAISCAITISLSIWKISNIFQFIEKLEKFIEKSKLITKIGTFHRELQFFWCSIKRFYRSCPTFK